MGAIMKEDDCYIGGLLELMNLRFGIAELFDESLGGIKEMAVLQKEFNIFQEGRALSACFGLLNLGGFWNARTKQRWFQLIDALSSSASKGEKLNDHDRLMNIFIDNLNNPSPLPMYFEAHDAGGQRGPALYVTEQDHGPFYITSRHILVSIPMKPRQQRKTGVRKPKDRK